MTPYAFTGPYAACYDTRVMAMDERHVYMVHDILKSGLFKTAAEVGCWMGASSTAFIEAINAGAGFNATFCDVEITDSLRSVLSNCKHPERISTPHELSWNLLANHQFDFVLLDANHDLVPVSLELGALLMQRPLCLVAHDTSATDNGLARCEGARLLKRVFSELPDYQCIEDNEKRDGERTERGLFIAARRGDVFDAVTAAFKEWTQWER